MLEEARERFDHVNDVDSENRKHAIADARFIWEKGAQWPDAVTKERNNDFQPCLEASQLTQFIKQVVNDQRQNRPGIKVSAASGNASIKTAEILQGMVRHIEYDSRAEATYDTAFEQAVTSGRGYMRVVSDYEGPKSFNQKLVIKPIPDFLSAYIDPDYTAPDGSDAGWGFVAEKVMRSRFKKDYPKADESSFANLEQKWGDKDHIVVVDYYRRVCEKRTLYWLTDGTTVWKDEYEAVPGGPTKFDEREADSYYVEWFKLAGGKQMLEQYSWPGTMIPIIQVPGDEIMLEGKRIYQGLIRRVRDLQMAYNYLISAGMERVALAPKAPWVMAEGQDEGNQADWAEANRKPLSRLIYKPVTVDGILAPPPQRQAPVAGEMGLLQQAEIIKADIKSVLGMYESSLGMKGQETSGRAILAREKQGDNATFNFVDNLSRAIAHAGRIIVELVPHYYDTERTVGIVNSDDTKTTAQINKKVGGFDEAQQAIIENNVTEGEYAVAVECGPSYATRRKETADLTMQLVQAVPQIMQVAGDLVVRAQELPDADAFAKRLEKILPPPIQQELEAERQGDGGPSAEQQLAQAQQQLQQMQMQMQEQGAQMQEMGAQLQEAESGVQAATVKAQSDASSRIQAAEINAQTSIREAETKSATDIKRAYIDQETKLAIAKITKPMEEAAELGAEPEADAESPQSIAMQGIAQALQMLVQQSAAASAPRQVRVTEFDEQGMPIGGVSVPILQ